MDRLGPISALSLGLISAPILVPHLDPILGPMLAFHGIIAIPWISMQSPHILSSLMVDPIHINEGPVATMLLPRSLY